MLDSYIKPKKNEIKYNNLNMKKFFGVFIDFDWKI